MKHWYRFSCRETYHLLDSNFTATEYLLDNTELIKISNPGRLMQKHIEVFKWERSLAEKEKKER
jgi:hypothetical protein